MRLHRLGQPVVERLELVERLRVGVEPGNRHHRAEPHRAADDRQIDPKRGLLLDHPLDVRQRGRHREALEELGVRYVAVDVDDHSSSCFTTSVCMIDLMKKLRAPSGSDMSRGSARCGSSFSSSS